MTLNERIAQFQANDSILRQWQDSDALALVADCQAEIARLETQLERAEALLRKASAISCLEDIFDTQEEIAAYFREKEKP